MQVKTTSLELLKLKRITKSIVSSRHVEPLELPYFAGERETGTITWKTTWQFTIKLKHTYPVTEKIHLKILFWRKIKTSVPKILV